MFSSNSKDVVYKMTTEELKSSSLVSIPNMGVINYNGDINWECPCLGGLPYSKCGTEFREAFSCFYYSERDKNGTECVDYFDDLFSCFQKHPELLPKKSDENTNMPFPSPDVESGNLSDLLEN